MLIGISDMGSDNEYEMRGFWDVPPRVEGLFSENESESLKAFFDAIYGLTGNEYFNLKKDKYEE